MLAPAILGTAPTNPAIPHIDAVRSIPLVLIKANCRILEPKLADDVPLT